MIVLAGNVGVEMAAKKAGFDVAVPFSAGAAMPALPIRTASLSPR